MFHQHTFVILLWGISKSPLTSSSYLDLNCRVPQGSLLGNLFYIVYVNDIDKSLKHCNHLFYADDTVLYLTGKLQGSTYGLHR